MFYGGGSTATHTVSHPSIHTAPCTPQSHPQPSHSTAATARQSINFRREEESEHSSSSRSSNHSAPKTIYSHPSQAATQRFHATDGSSQTRPAAPQHHDTVHISEAARNLSAEANSSQAQRTSVAFRHEEEASRSVSTSHPAADTAHPATTVSTVASHRFQPTSGGSSAVTNEHHDTVQISERARQLSAQTQGAVNQRARVQFLHEEQLSKDSDSQHQNAKPMSAAERRVNVAFQREEQQSTPSDTQQTTRPLTPAERRANIEFQREEDSSKPFAPRCMEEQLKDKYAYSEGYYNTQVAPHDSFAQVSGAYFDGIGHSIAQTGKGLAYIVEHPVQTLVTASEMATPGLSQYMAIKQMPGAIRTTVQTYHTVTQGSPEDKAYILGDLTGQAGFVFLTRGAGEEVDGVALTSKISDMASATKSKASVVRNGLTTAKNNVNQWKGNLTFPQLGPNLAVAGGGPASRFAIGDGGNTLSYIRVGSNGAKGTGNPYGTYEDAPYHGKVSNSIKNKAPIDGQAALNGSVSIGPNTTRRVGVSDGEIVVLDETSPGVYHGHVRSWSELTPQMQSTLRKAGLVDKKGRIIEQ